MTEMTRPAVGGGGHGSGQRGATNSLRAYHTPKRGGWARRQSSWG